MRRTRGKQALQEFLAGTLPVVHILSGSFPPHEDGSRTPLHVAVFDASTRPDLDLQDLIRLIASESEGESDTEFAWDCCETRHDLLIRLTCAYQTPVQGQFALLFRYSQHRDYLRWVVEHGNTVPIADVSWSEQLASEHPLFLCPPDENFASRLRLLRLHQQMIKEQRTRLTEPEIASILFEVKRVASYGELARFAEEALQIQVSGTDSEYFPNAFAGRDACLQVQQLSRDFHRFLVHVMLVPGMTAGLSLSTFVCTGLWSSSALLRMVKMFGRAVPKGWPLPPRRAKPSREAGLSPIEREWAKCQAIPLFLRSSGSTSEFTRTTGKWPFFWHKRPFFESYASLLIRATDQRRSKKLFGLRSTSARFRRKCFFPLSANLRKIHSF